MNIAKNMEVIFTVAVTISCAALFLTTTAPTITVNVSAPMASQTALVQTNA